MPAPIKPHLEAGRVYRTRELGSSHPARLAKRLVAEGELRLLSHGLYFRPKKGRFGEVPPTEEELLRGFLGDQSFIITGPERWNTLNLGSTAAFAAPLVYNRKRTGEFQLGKRRFHLRRVAFPEQPDEEWYVIDLLENADAAAMSRDSLERALAEAVRQKRFDSAKLAERAEQFGTERTRAAIRRVNAAKAEQQQ